MKALLLTLLLFASLVAVAQDAAPDEYYALVKKADSLYKAKDYKNSAFTYSAAFKSFGWKAYGPDRYNAACSWALAGYADSAFFNLNRITTKANYSDLNHISTDEDLISLHNDSRWQPLLKLVEQNRDKLEANLNKPLVRTLDSLEKEDQKWRNYMTNRENGEIKSDSLSDKEITRRMILADSLDYLLVREIFFKYGFPNLDLVGAQGSGNFWLLVQHQDRHPQFQDSVLAKMKIEVDAGKASATDYAYLVDRVKVNTKQLQVYGTQMQMNADSTSFTPKPVIEPEKLNERRKSMGMPTEESYIDVMNKHYSGALKKK